MQRSILALVIALACRASVWADTHKVPEENTVATVEAPDSWKAEDDERGIELGSDDGEVYIAVQVIDAKGEKAMEEAARYLKKKGVTLDDKPARIDDSQKDRVLVSWDGKDEEGPAKIQLMVLNVNPEKAVLFICWASPDGEKKHEEEIAAIARSVKKS